MTLAKRTAIVTGGASGIGRGIASVLGAQGAAVAVADMNAAGAQETVGAIETAGGTAGAFSVDITDVAQVGRMVAEVKARAHFVSKWAGGAGAVREVVEMVLRARGMWDAIVATYEAEGQAGR